MVKIEVSRVHKLDAVNGAPTKGFADICVADSFIIKGCKIIDGTEGLFVAMPKECGKDGKWYNVVVPMNREVMDEVSRLVLEAYEDMK
jgi:stage V sporulation protein G